MSDDNDLQRTVPMEITIAIEGGMSSTRRFKLYPGTEIVYGQGVDLAVSRALATISKVAFDIINGAEGAPENLAIEAMFGKGVLDASE